MRKREREERKKTNREKNEREKDKRKRRKAYHRVSTLDCVTSPLVIAPYLSVFSISS